MHKHMHLQPRQTEKEEPQNITEEHKKDLNPGKVTQDFG